MNAMTGPQSFEARAISDSEDALVRADEPLAGLQLRCGGTIPGAVAIPQLRELLALVRRDAVAMSRPITVLDGSELVRAWVEAKPLGPGQGCEIVVVSWQSAPAPGEDALAVDRRRLAIDRHVAELTAQLDRGQRVLVVHSATPELDDLAAAMRQGAGRAWTDFIPPVNATHHQPLHWRLLDGAPVTVEGSSRGWRVVLVPLMRPGSEPSGFELLLLSDEPAPLPLPEGASTGARPHQSLVGRDIAPVLKQPITRIVANAETIRTRMAGPLPDAYAEYAGEIVGAGRLLLDLFGDMADLEALEAEDFSTSPEPVDLVEVARQAAGILGVRAREKAITIELPDAAGPGPGAGGALGEFRRVLQVLLNLVGNAIRYSAERSVIRIGVEPRGERVAIWVEDEGPGLSEEEQGRVFEKFERLGRSGDGGSGLGLYISRRLARAMGGELTVASQPGQGARFTLEIPADLAALAC